MAAAGLLMSVAAASAAPLDPETCQRSKVEHEGLVQAGVRDDLARGPDWVRANLPADRLERVRRYLALEEAIKFRCPEPPPAPAAAAAPNGEAAPARKSRKRARPEAAAAPGGVETGSAGEPRAPAAAPAAGTPAAASQASAPRPAAAPAAAKPKPAVPTAPAAAPPSPAPAERKP